MMVTDSSSGVASSRRSVRLSLHLYLCLILYLVERTTRYGGSDVVHVCDSAPVVVIKAVMHSGKKFVCARVRLWVRLSYKTTNHQQGTI